MAKVSVKRHLKELQWRLVLVAAFFITGAVLAYNFQAQLVPALLNPLHGEKLVYLNPAGGFSFIFLISIYAGIALSLPVLIQQLYAFLRPALPDTARRRSSIIIVCSFLLLTGGISFGYFFAVPGALDFLYGFADQYVNASLTADSYLNFLIAYTIGIGIVFQIPLLLLLVNSIRPISPGGLMKSEKWVVLIAFIVAAIITPTPDPINQAIIAGPVIIVYQFGVIAILISHARRRHQAKKALKLEAKQAAYTAKQAQTISTAAEPLGNIFADEPIDDTAIAKQLKSLVAQQNQPVRPRPTQAAPVVPLQAVQEPIVLRSQAALAPQPTNQRPQTQAEAVIVQTAAQNKIEAPQVTPLPVAQQGKLVNDFGPRPQQRSARLFVPPTRPVERPVQPRTSTRSIDGFIRVPRTI